MEPIFCCSSIRPYRPQKLSHEAKFTAFMEQATALATIVPTTFDAVALLNKETSYVVQVVRQVNYGAVEWKKHFAYTKVDGGSNFQEVSEKDLIDANYQKLNSYKNFKCIAHNRFFELNIYEKDPVNRHHWLANIARPAGDIDLALKSLSISETTSRAPTQPSDPVGEGSVPQECKENKEYPEAATSSPAPTANEVSTAVSCATSIAEEEEGGDHTKLDRAFDHDYDRENYQDYGIHSDGYDTQSEKDFTACSADDCGYCGHCDY